MKWTLESIVCIFAHARFTACFWLSVTFFVLARRQGICLFVPSRGIWFMTFEKLRAEVENMI